LRTYIQKWHFLERSNDKYMPLLIYIEKNALEFPQFHYSKPVLDMKLWFWLLLSELNTRQLLDETLDKNRGMKKKTKIC
jgi:hypothetical protein